MVRRLVWLLLSVCLGAAVRAETVQVAVAANFTAPMQKIAAAFQKDTGHKAMLSFEASGKLYAQIRHGAPFDVLLAADDRTPAKLVAEGQGVSGSVFTYAIGQLVLWSAQAGVVDAQGAVLEALASGQRAGKLAIADPRLAPYGAAAMQVMERRSLAGRLRPHWVTGTSIGQTFQFVKSGNALIGFVALSQVMTDGQLTGGSVWTVPPDLHAPIRQDAVLLQRGRDNPAARALLAYLQGDTARAVIRAYGYRPWRSPP